jgi:hypothetical protein
VPQAGHGRVSVPSKERQSKHAPPRRSLGSTTRDFPQKMQCAKRSSSVEKLRPSEMDNMTRDDASPAT